MNLKENIIEYGINFGIVLGAFYLIYGKKFNTLNFVTLAAIVGSRYAGKLVDIMLQKDNAGGTASHNPLKIPKK